MRRRLILGLFGLALWAPAWAEPPDPLPYIDKSAAPALTEVKQVKMTTDLGEVLIDVYPAAAPNAAQRFLELVKSGFYDNTPVFRVVPGFVAQFGINWRDPHKAWKENNFKDDPSLFKLDKGTLAFAKAGPNTNSTQVFINYGDNSRLATQGGFSTFAKVVSGMDVVEKFKAVGDPRMGLDQEALWNNGEAYLQRQPDKPNMILKAEVVDPPKTTE